MRTALLTLTMCVLAASAQAKYSGGTGEPNDPYQIATAADLIALGETPADYGKHFLMTADIDLNPELPGRKVFDKAVIAPDMNDANWQFDGTPFAGVFDGNGHVISHLRITGGSCLGLFGTLSGGVKNLGLVDVKINGSTIHVGGLVGSSQSGSVTNCYSTGAISSTGHCVGGLVGTNGGSISTSSSVGSVRGNLNVGGLVGVNRGTVIQCYSTGAVSSTGDWVGGLVGFNYAGIVTQCYSTGAVSGSKENVGGLVGENLRTVIASFWDTQASGQASSSGGEGKTTAEMQTAETFLDAGWHLVGETANGTEDIWWILEGKSYPHLWWEPLMDGAGRDLYVAANGDDRNPGTEALPFRTINRACLRSLDRYGRLPVGGVTIWIRNGIYRETVRPAHSATAEAPIRFAAYPGEVPVVSGADTLDVPWKLHAGKIYKASTTVEFEQLFVDGQMMQEARWPNTSTRDLVRARRATCDNGTNRAILIDDALPPGDWSNAYVNIRPGPGWSYCAKQITNYEPGKSLEFSDRDWQLQPLIEPRPGNHYWLFGSLAGLDRATEWLRHSSGTLYIWCPGDPNPATHTIEVKQREHAFDLSGCAYIRIEGLRVFAAGIVMENSTHCSVVDCHLKYPLWRRIVPAGIHFLPRDWTSNKMSGNYNEWKKTAIAFSSGQGIYDLGEHDKVANCIIHDFDLAASGTSGISAFAAPFGEYTYNTICECGGGGITLWTPFSMRVEHNHIYNVGVLRAEGQPIGIASTPDGAGTIIAYNRLHDGLGERSYAINMAEGACGLRVHHNLIWNMPLTGFLLCAVELDNEIYNNTVFNCPWAFSFGHDAAVPLLGGRTRIINNIANGPMEFLTKPSALHHNGYYAIDANGWPTADSGAIDAGVVIPGITDGYMGAAPDIGCFEVGTEPWRAGADWEETAFTRISNTEGFETGDFIEFDWWPPVGCWFATSAEKHSGFYSAQSRAIADDEDAILQVTLDCRPGEITFWRKVSSEQRADYLIFSVDRIEKGRWSGEQDWAEVSFPVTGGKTTFAWRYTKDSENSGGRDAAWIDDIAFPLQ